MTSHFEPEWQRLYVEALIEINPQVLVERVSVAEKAILSRVAELCTSSDDRIEWKAIEDAITGMAVLRRDLEVVSKCNHGATSAYHRHAPNFRQLIAFVA